MKKIVKANIAENRYRFFTVVDELPEVGDIIERGQYEVLAVNAIRLDPEQPSSEVFEYDYYEVVKKDLFDSDEETIRISRDYVCVRWNDPVQELFEKSAKRYGTIEWDGVELAITQDPYPDGSVDDWCFTATAMDRAGNLWEVCWYPKPDADECLDYASQVEDWDKPDSAEMVDEGYYLD